MEYVDGPNLEQWLTERVRNRDELLSVFAQIVDGTKAVHQRGIIHRDLKPSNILLSQVDGVWLPKVSDFGIAMLKADADTDPYDTQLVGTPSYMAPEQREMQALLDERADIYSLGCILSRMLLGAPHPLESCPKRLDDLPDELQRLLMRAIKHDRAHRIQSCAQLGEALARAQAALTDSEPSETKTGSLGMNLASAQAVEVPSPSPLEPSHQPHVVYLSYASSDSPYARRYAMDLRNQGDVVIFERSRSEVISAADREAIVGADEIVFLWSREARVDARVCHELELAWRVGLKRSASPDSAHVREWMHGVSIDNTALPWQLDDSLGSPSPWTGLGIVGVAGLGFGGHLMGWDAAWRWVLVGALLPLGLLLLAGQLARSPKLMTFSSSLQRLANWMERGSIVDVLTICERWMDAVFGRELLTWRSLALSAVGSALLATLMLVPIIKLNEAPFGWESDFKLTFSGLFGFLIPVLLLKVTMEYLSMTAARWLIRVGRVRPCSYWLVGVLTLDAAILSLFVTLLIMPVGPLGELGLTAELWFAYPDAVVSPWWHAMTGAPDWEIMLRSQDLFLYVVNGLAVFGSCLPSFLYAALLAMILVNRMIWRAPSRFAREAIMRWIRAPWGPWSATYLLLVMLSTGLLLVP